VIKYLGSKRRLLPLLVSLATPATPATAASATATPAGARTALDLFSGTARVASALKRAGMTVTAVDSATYAHVLARSYVETDAGAIDERALRDAIARLDALAGRRGYVTKVFCETARYFHPDNGRRIDAIRDEIELAFADSPLYPVLLTSLLEAADRVDSTTGLQMAYLKQWAPRALRPLELRVPELHAGAGRAVLGDARALVAEGALGPVDVAYLDPPYNQHRYFTNYHVWETIVRWDDPEHYGVACKRIDCRDEETASEFNRRRKMPEALAATIAGLDAELLLVSYNNESWLTREELVAMCNGAVAARLGSRSAREIAIIEVDSPRYVGARIGIHNPAGEKVGEVSHVRNTELVLVAGSAEAVSSAVDRGMRAARLAGLGATVSAAVCAEPAGR
jgi:adenine-specific DNA-methyltransferase